MDEKELAQVIENAVNNFSFNPKKVAEQVPFMHRTLQQNVYKLCKAIIEVIGAEDYATDPRNQASHDEASNFPTHFSLGTSSFTTPALLLILRRQCPHTAGAAGCQSARDRKSVV